MSDEQHRALRRSLRRTWRPFFSRFGGLTSIQMLAAPKILAGQNVVVSAPTASGKTEAVVGPVAERHAAEGWSPIAVLYIVPTRALANDTLERIGGPLGDMGLTAVLKHGDSSRLPASPPDWLITTPESLDSLICRQPDALRGLRAVILDEIHLLDNTYRGDQLRVLLARLRELCDSPSLAVHLLSATLPQPEELARRYTDSFELVTVSGQRAINYRFVTEHEEIRALAVANTWRKLLYFCNRRDSVEKTAAELAQLWRPYPVVAHHGSLDRKLREEAEQVMKEQRAAVCVATSTLEIGIDIGDIDLVVLAEPPWSIQALLQRVGRGSRRSNKVEVAALVTSAAEQSLLEAMFATAEAGLLTIEPYRPNLSVAVQQILSYAFQHRSGVREEALAAIVAPLCDVQVAMAIVQYLAAEEWLQRRGRLWYPTTRLLDEAEKGKLHSNVPDHGTFRVIDVESAQDVGTVTGVFDEVFLLGGLAWQIVSVEYGVLRVRRYAGRVAATCFRAQHNRGAYQRLLPPALRAL